MHYLSHSKHPQIGKCVLLLLKGRKEGDPKCFQDCHKASIFSHSYRTFSNQKAQSRRMLLLITRMLTWDEKPVLWETAFKPSVTKTGKMHTQTDPNEASMLRASIKCNKRDKCIFVVSFLRPPVGWVGSFHLLFFFLRNRIRHYPGNFSIQSLCDCIFVFKETIFGIVGLEFQLFVLSKLSRERYGAGGNWIS